jgi:hypothetical protein
MIIYGLRPLLPFAISLSSFSKFLITLTLSKLSSCKATTQSLTANKLFISCTKERKKEKQNWAIYVVWLLMIFVWV